MSQLYTCRVTIITGYLGAGKTTLLLRLLAQYPEDKTTVIVNEWGEVGVDGELLEQAGNQIKEIVGGCICCKSQAELAYALDDIARQPNDTERVFIETSGAASPAGVIRILERYADAFAFNGVLTVLDITRLDELVHRPLAREQMALADIVIATHIDLCTPTALAIKLSEAQEWSPASLVLATDSDTLPARLDALVTRSKPYLHDRAYTPHSHLDSACLRQDGDLNEERFLEWVETDLADYDSQILRIKGIISFANVAERVIMQGVSGRLSVSFGATWNTAVRGSRVVIIGHDLDTNRLQQGFAKCAQA